jgi:hypothetical protein
VYISATSNRTCAVTAEGGLFIWGATLEKGILSTDVASTYSPIPTKVPGIQRAVQVSAAEDFTIVTLAIDEPKLPLFKPSSAKKFRHNSIDSVASEASFQPCTTTTTTKTTSTSFNSNIQNEATIPTLQQLCQRRMCETVTVNSVFPSFFTSRKYFFPVWHEFCKTFIIK